MSQNSDADTQNSPHRTHRHKGGGRRTAQEPRFQTRKPTPTDDIIPEYRNLLPEPASHTPNRIVSLKLPTGIPTSHTQESPTSRGDHGQPHHNHSENNTTRGEIQTSSLKNNPRYHKIRRPSARKTKPQVPHTYIPKAACHETPHTQNTFIQTQNPTYTERTALKYTENLLHKPASHIPAELVSYTPPT